MEGLPLLNIIESMQLGHNKIIVCQRILPMK